MDFKNFDDKGDLPQRKMYQGNWKCSECQSEITELPFEPSNKIYYQGPLLFIQNKL